MARKEAAGTTEAAERRNIVRKERPGKRAKEGQAEEWRVVVVIPPAGSVTGTRAQQRTKKLCCAPVGTRPREKGVSTTGRLCWWLLIDKEKTKHKVCRYFRWRTLGSRAVEIGKGMKSSEAVPSNFVLNKTKASRRSGRGISISRCF